MRREEFNSLYYSIHRSASSVVAAVCCLSRASISVFTSALGYSFFYCLPQRPFHSNKEGRAENEQFHSTQSAIILHCTF